MEEVINVYYIFVGKSEGKRPVGEPRHRWEDNIRMDLSQIAWEVVDWMNLAQDREQWRALANTVVNSLLEKDPAPWR
jgi:hypothetical protein